MEILKGARGLHDSPYVHAQPPPGVESGSGHSLGREVAAEDPSQGEGELGMWWVVGLHASQGSKPRCTL